MSVFILILDKLEHHLCLVSVFCHNFNHILKVQLNKDLVNFNTFKLCQSNRIKL